MYELKIQTFWLVVKCRNKNENVRYGDKNKDKGDIDSKFMILAIFCTFLSGGIYVCNKR